MGGGASPEWIRLAMKIVEANQRCSANRLRMALRQQGASVRAANETLLILIRDGYVRRTWSGEAEAPLEAAGLFRIDVPSDGAAPSQVVVHLADLTKVPAMEAWKRQIPAEDLS
jgi:hypothetical protein